MRFRDVSPEGIIHDSINVSCRNKEVNGVKSYLLTGIGLLAAFTASSCQRNPPPQFTAALPPSLNVTAVNTVIDSRDLADLLEVNIWNFDVRPTDTQQRQLLRHELIYFCKGQPPLILCEIATPIMDDGRVKYTGSHRLTVSMYPPGGSLSKSESLKIRMQIKAGTIFSTASVKDNPFRDKGVMIHREPARQEDGSYLVMVPHSSNGGYTISGDAARNEEYVLIRFSTEPLPFPRREPVIQ